MDRIRKEKLRVPHKAQLVSFLQALRVKKFGPARICAADLQSWCEERLKIPADEDEVFVVDFHIRATSYDVADQELRIVLSTRRLLSIFKKSRMLQADATYKLLWNGFPVLLVGTSDSIRVFHPFLLSVTSGETAEDFEFVFRALHNFHPEWVPTVLLADGADAITKAFTSVFGEPLTRLMCYFHVTENIEKYLKPLCTRKCDLGKQVKEDIRILQLCQNEDMFLKATNLFLQKWKKNTDARLIDFMNYFEAQWLKKLPNWYEGAALDLPSSNNGLEGTNGVIKREHTVRARLPLSQFLSNVTDLLESWSRRRDPSSDGCTMFAEVRKVGLRDWTEAYQWAIQGEALERNAINRTLFFVASTRIQKPISPNLVHKFEREYGKWKTFDSFAEWRSRIGRLRRRRTAFGHARALFL